MRHSSRVLYIFQQQGPSNLMSIHQSQASTLGFHSFDTKCSISWLLPHEVRHSVTQQVKGCVLPGSWSTGSSFFSSFLRLFAPIFFSQQNPHHHHHPSPYYYFSYARFPALLEPVVLLKLPLGGNCWLLVPVRHGLMYFLAPYSTCLR